MRRIVASLLASLLAVPASAQAPLDPLDPASCDVADGWMTVLEEFVIAWDAATQSGQLGEPRSTEIAGWYVKQLNRIAETNDTRGVCLDSIALRNAERF